MFLDCVEHGGKFKVSSTYVRTWAKERLAWSFWKPTSNASKLPIDWEKCGESLMMNISCLVVGFEIPQTLVVNGDQKTIHLLPVDNEWTYTTHGARDVKVASRGDKR